MSPTALSGADELLTVKEAAAVFRCHHLTLHRWVKEGKAPVQPRRLGRRILFSKREIEAWLAKAS